MAIIKSIPTQYGIDATYWRVMKFMDINVLNLKVSFMLYGWVDQQTHDEGKEPLDTRIIECIGAEFQTLAIQPTLENETVYSALKRVCELKALELDFAGGEQI
jgi:hypothetical protein